MSVVLKLPRKDGELQQWGRNVVNVVTPDPEAWGLGGGDVAAFTALHDAFAASLKACAPAVRNSVAVAAKNSARAALEAGAAVLANKVGAAPGVSDAMKVQVGMPPRRPPSVVPAPATAPVIAVLAVTGCTVRVRLRDASSGSRRGKPPGTKGASIFTFVGAQPPSDPAAWTFRGSAGRVTEVDVVFEPAAAPPGTRVWLTAFWFNARLQAGPNATPVGANLPGGGVSMAA